MNPLDFNYDRVALSKYLVKCQKLYKDEGLLVSDLRNSVNRYITEPEEKLAPSTFQKVLYGWKDHGSKARYLILLSAARVEAIAQFTSKEIDKANWPKGLESATFGGVVKWLDWRDPEEVKEEASSDKKRYYIKRVDTAVEENQELKERIQALEGRVKELEASVSRLQASGGVIVSHPFTQELATVLESKGVAVSDHEAIKSACEGLEHGEAIFRMIAGLQIPDLDYIKGIDLAMKELVGEGWASAAITAMIGAAALDPGSFALLRS